MPELTGRVRGLMIMQAGRSPVSTPQQQIEIVADGVLGDIHAGRTRLSKGVEVPNTRQVTLVSQEELAQVASDMGIPEIKAEWVGANILIEGMPELSALPPGARLVFPGGAWLVVEMANTPCTSAGRSIQSHFPDRHDLPALFPKTALGKRGLLAWVQHGGHIYLGDEMRVVLPV